jgi:hypothetical protein
MAAADPDTLGTPTAQPDQELDAAEASALTIRDQKTVYSKRVGIKGISFDGNTHVTINLSKPYKGVVQVTVLGGITATNGATGSGKFVALVR